VTRLSAVHVLLASTFLVGAAAAQPISTKLTCHNLGVPTTETVPGQQNASAIRVNEYTCTVSGGPLDGGIMTAMNIWEVRGADWTALVSTGVTRRPDGYSVFRVLDGKLTLHMKDGKPAGFTATGKGQIVAAAGAGAPFAGRSYTWKTYSLTPTTFMIESTFD
jgi:hypothetical protein